MVTNRDIQLKQGQQSTKKEETRDIRLGYITAISGDLNGDIPQRLWIQSISDNTGAIQVLNPGVVQRPSVGMLVYYERDPKEPAKWQLIQFKRSAYADDLLTLENLPQAGLQPHAIEHIYRPGNPGADPIDIYPRALTEFRVTPTNPASMKVQIFGGWYPGATNYQRFEGPVDSADLTSYVPSTTGKASILAICLNQSGAIEYVAGTEYVNGLPVPSAAWPVVSGSKLILSAVRLVQGMTSVTEVNFDKEIRPLLVAGGLNVKVDRVYESDFGGIAAQTDAAGNVVFNHDAKIYSGNDLLLYSDTGSTLTMRTVNGFGDFRLTSITHINDGDTLVSFGTDIVNIYAGNAKMLIADGAAAQKVLKLGGVDGLFDVDVNINSNQVFLDYGNDVVLINTIVALAGVFGLPKLQIDRIDNGAMMLHRESADDGGPTLEFLKRRSGWDVLSDGDRLFTIGFSGADGVDAALAGQIYGEVDGTPGSNDMPGRLIIALSPDGSATTVERVRIISTGKITITGTTGIINLNADGGIEGGTTGGSFIIQPYSGSNNNIIVNALSTGALYLNYLSGTGGILFGDGAVGVTGGVQSNGRMGLGTTSSQARLHTYDTIGGSLHNWIYDGLDGTSRTIIPDGAGDVLYGCRINVVLRDSSGNFTGGVQNIANGTSANITVGANTVTFAVSAAGALTVSRTAGGDTIKANGSLIWL